MSPSTVSQVLGGKRPVAPQTAERVRASIERLRFRPNAVARALRTQRTHSVAFVIPNIAHVVYPIVARGVGDVLKPLGYHLTIYETDADPALTTELLQTAMDQGVDGFILFGFTASEHDAELLRLASVPFVNGGLAEEVSPGWDTHRSDQRRGIIEATQLALGAGAPAIAFVGGRPGSGPADLREAGFRQAMAQAGRAVDESLVERVDYSYQGGREAMERLLRRAVQPPAAVVCANDLIAIGAMAVARGHGLDVPSQVMISGYDNIETCEMVQPALTSIEPGLQAQGRACAEMLLRRLQGSAGPPEHEVSSVRLVERSSARLPGPPPTAGGRTVRPVATG